ncbi:ABC transporter permease, partial [Candidatus Poribacteria bacterium]|nr:ABC transporter permease [Candidatus Poribacteria bacterium]
YQFYALSSQLGRSFYYFIFRGIPIFAVMVAFFPWEGPHSFLAFILFLPSLALGVVITFSLRFLVGISAFWFLDTKGFRAIVMGAGTFLSGFMLPISFFPSGFAKVCEWMPFVGQSYIPVAIYLGKYTGMVMMNMLIRQVGWTIILIVTGKILMSMAVRKLVIQGG